MVASRLSEQPEWKVLLLEAGPDEPPGTDLPSMVAMFLGTSPHTFDRKSGRTEIKKMVDLEQEAISIGVIGRRTRRTPASPRAARVSGHVVKTSEAPRVTTA